MVGPLFLFDFHAFLCYNVSIMNKIEILKDNDVVFGDPHGCLNSVLDLCKAMNVNIDRDRVFLAGDILDKGPQSKELMDAMITYGWEAIQGNHDEKILRYARGSKIKVNGEIADTVRQLGDNWQDYALRIAEWPLYKAFEDSQGPGFVVQGGVSPDRPIHGQSSNNLLRMRTWPFEVYNRDRPLTQPLWQESYKGHLGTILHGRKTHESKGPNFEGGSTLV